jgi:hypothetical protein
MKHATFFIVLFVLVPTLALSQEVIPKKAGQAYAFVAPGMSVGSCGAVGFLNFGGGGEVNLYRSLGMGFDLGYLSPIEYLGDGIGLFSLNGLYTFKRGSNSKVVPFVTGGYSLAFRGGHANALNLGVGAHYWFSKKAGLRLEFRDYLSPSYASCHILQGRFGISFR